ncbi:MAG: glycoside hydrolase family 88 protein [Paludibacteraceae bacterium]|nr:glycoside hydrolase family 88 protein [Paludibacteraceae bacterium]
MYRRCFIILFVGLLACPLAAADFQPDTIYSRWVINSHLGHFNNKSVSIGFKTDTSRCTAQWDYVPGLVAKGVLKACEQYQDQSWAQPWFESMYDYALHAQMKVGLNNIDDLNAAKIFFELYRGALRRGDQQHASFFRQQVDSARNILKYHHRRISANLPGSGGFWHKNIYPNQMWLDGLYMGTAMYGEWQGNFDPDDTASWNDIAAQFDTIFVHTWDADKQLCYHAWSAQPMDKRSVAWADSVTGRSSEFWARGMGWYFAALIDVLEYMPANQPSRRRLEQIVGMVADGLRARQDASGCWYQLLQYNDALRGSCGQFNYLESSASSMYAYCYLKGIRIGVLDPVKYMPVAQRAYRGLIEQFVQTEPDGTISLINSCESAGLSAKRIGDADYYLCGSDVVINHQTEGKVLGPFIMASLEYERLSESRQP